MGETEGTGASAIVQGVVGEGSRRRLPVPLLTARAPWDLPAVLDLADIERGHGHPPTCDKRKNHNRRHGTTSVS